ncbi:hypothetical protein CSUB01_12159 [Colletotrichum sublineola]|uniref:Uncharacterized protein n=1 Tax=Colletotrichum sublineola TaxID=1173701 RepID=A0A066X4H5_COLSU|nr:hypothetical protein CSUB01_12159 [Colletotrichum sublineola]
MFPNLTAMKFSAFAFSASSLILPALAAPAPAPAAGAPVAPFTILCATAMPSDSLSSSDIQSVIDNNRAALDLEGNISNETAVNCVTNDGRIPTTQPGVQLTYQNAHNDQAQVPAGDNAVICSRE